MLQFKEKLLFMRNLMQKKGIKMIKLNLESVFIFENSFVLSFIKYFSIPIGLFYKPN